MATAFPPWREFLFLPLPPMILASSVLNMVPCTTSSFLTVPFTLGLDALFEIFHCIAFSMTVFFLLFSSRLSHCTQLSWAEPRAVHDSWFEEWEAQWELSRKCCPTIWQCALSNRRKIKVCMHRNLDLTPTCVFIVAPWLLVLFTVRKMASLSCLRYQS